jgi:MoaA/NifB/PqqE/SkfB family radical SAM enzyme
VLSKIFDEAWQAGSRRLHLTGGEPLLRDDLHEIIAAARERGYFISLATSGANADRQIPALQQCDQVMLSFDGPHEVREQLCGRASADAAEEAVRILSQEKIPFWTTTVLTRFNLDSIDWIVEHAAQHRTAANFVLLHSRPSGGGTLLHPTRTELAELCPTNEQYRSAILRLLELKRSGRPVGLSLPCLREWLEWEDYTSMCDTHRAKRYRQCLATRCYCEVGPDGRVFGCDQPFGENYPAPSAIELGFGEAFRQIPWRTDCRSCMACCYIETNLLFSLHPQAVWNWFRLTRH